MRKIDNRESHIKVGMGERLFLSSLRIIGSG